MVLVVALAVAEDRVAWQLDALAWDPPVGWPGWIELAASVNDTGEEAALRVGVLLELRLERAAS